MHFGFDMNRIDIFTFFLCAQFSNPTGKDYPLPIVDHAEASHRNIERMRKVYNNLSRHGGPGILGSVPSSKAASAPPKVAKPNVSSKLMPEQQQHQQQIQEAPVAQSPNNSILMPRPRKMRFMGMGMGHMQMPFSRDTGSNMGEGSGIGGGGVGAGVSEVSVVPDVRGMEVSRLSVTDVTSHLPGSSTSTLSYQPSLLIQQHHQHQHPQQQHQQQQQMSQQHMPVTITGLSPIDVPGTSGSLLKELEGADWQSHWQFTNQ
nr:uncharacterized protein LOC129283148 [Lytechinus pictus]